LLVDCRLAINRTNSLAGNSLGANACWDVGRGPGRGRAAPQMQS
jgi:hypothetical protein